MTPAEAVEYARRVAGCEARSSRTRPHIDDLVAAGVLRWCRYPWVEGAGTTESTWSKKQIRYGVLDELRAIFGRGSLVHRKPLELPMWFHDPDDRDFDGDEFIHPADTRGTPEEHYDAVELLERLNTAPKAQRQMLTDLLNGMSGREVAARDGISSGAVTHRRNGLLARCAA